MPLGAEVLTHERPDQLGTVAPVGSLLLATCFYHNPRHPSSLESGTGVRPADPRRQLGDGRSRRCTPSSHPLSSDRGPDHCSCCWGNPDRFAAIMRSFAALDLTPNRTRASCPAGNRTSSRSPRCSDEDKLIAYTGILTAYTESKHGKPSDGSSIPNKKLTIEFDRE